LGKGGTAWRNHSKLSSFKFFSLYIEFGRSLNEFLCRKSYRRFTRFPRLLLSVRIWLLFKARRRSERSLYTPSGTAKKEFLEIVSTSRELSSQMSFGNYDSEFSSNYKISKCPRYDIDGVTQSSRLFLKSKTLRLRNLKIQDCSRDITQLFCRSKWYIQSGLSSIAWRGIFFSF